MSSVTFVVLQTCLSTLALKDKSVRPNGNSFRIQLCSSTAPTGSETLGGGSCSSYMVSESATVPCSSAAVIASGDGSEARSSGGRES
jgi:hypothetical protein